MNLPKKYSDRILSITDSINHMALNRNKNQHLPDKIACLKTNIELLKLEAEQMVKLRQKVLAKKGEK